MYIQKCDRNNSLTASAPGLSWHKPNPTNLNPKPNGPVRSLQGEPIQEQPIPLKVTDSPTVRQSNSAGLAGSPHKDLTFHNRSTEFRHQSAEIRPRHQIRTRRYGPKQFRPAGATRATGAGTHVTAGRAARGGGEDGGGRTPHRHRRRGHHCLPPTTRSSAEAWTVSGEGASSGSLTPGPSTQGACMAMARASSGRRTQSVS